MLWQQQQIQSQRQETQQSSQLMPWDLSSPSQSGVGRNTCTPSSTSLSEAVRENGASLQVPLPAAQCESMLRWPIFNGIIEDSDAQIESFLFEADIESHPIGHAKGMPSELIRHDDFVPLCRRFLDHVHPRNPILQKEELMSYALEVAANGLRWDADSCLVVRLSY